VVVVVVVVMLTTSFAPPPPPPPPPLGVEPLTQILFNDQSSRDCAYSFMDKCHPTHYGGYYRTITPTTTTTTTTTTSPPSISSGSSDGASIFATEEKKGSSSSNSSSSSSGGGGGGSSSSSITYSLHEFGSMDPHHDFSYWPGLSLNPALWDLVLLRQAMTTTTTSSGGGTGSSMFDEGDDRFEQSWSLKGYYQGVVVGYLHRHVFMHNGDDISAYNLNGEKRGWESSSS